MTATFDPPADDLVAIVARTLAEDVDARGDVTTRAMIAAETMISGAIVARAEGILAGTAAAAEVFRQVDADVKVVWLRHDGDRLRADVV
jgi:nicotinate-nucleotide pyrophosphorylase (carboxylating)